MFFNNLLVYRITQPETLNLDTLEAALADHQAIPCASQQASTYGFAPFDSKAPDSPMLFIADGFALVTALAHDRILPASVVREEVQTKIDQIETQEQRKVYKKEADQIKDEIVQTLLPRAFVRKTITRAAIDLNAGLIYVNSPSASRAEALLSGIREALGSFPVRPVALLMPPVMSFTNWVSSETAGPGFTLLDECEMRDIDQSGGVIKIKREDLGGEEIQNLLETGKLVTQLALAWDDKLTFVLDDKLAIKRLRFADILHDQALSDAGEDDKYGYKAASFSLMMRTFAQFIPELLDTLGGEAVPEPAV